MLKYISKRLVNCVLVILIAVTAVFFAIRLVPANFVDTKLPIEQQEKIKESLGFNRPLGEQYTDYLTNAAKLDLGKSLKIQKNVPVKDIIADKMKISLPIGLIAIAISMVMGVLIGTAAAVNRGKAIDHGATLITVLGISIPSVVVSIILQYLFTFLGFPTIYDSTNFTSVIAPIIALSFWPTASIAKYIRNELIDVMNSEYILLAQAKGVPSKRILFVHGLRNALIPAITVLGPLFVSTIIGGLVVEKIFAIPGLGGLMSQAITLTDYTIIQGLTFLFAALFTLTYLVIDILYGVIDPRIYVSGGKK